MGLVPGEPRLIFYAEHLCTALQMGPVEAEARQEVLNQLHCQLLWFKKQHLLGFSSQVRECTQCILDSLSSTDQGLDSRED